MRAERWWGYLLKIPTDDQIAISQPTRPTDFNPVDHLKQLTFEALAAETFQGAPIREG